MEPFERFRGETFRNVKIRDTLMDTFEYLCHCDARYVGHTTQKLQKQIQQYVPNQ